MIIMLRNSRGENVVDVELFETDDIVVLHSTVDISAYSRLLISRMAVLDNSDASVVAINETIEDFDNIYRMEGWLHQNYFIDRENTSKDFDAVLARVKGWLKDTGEKYKLDYVED